MTNEIADTTRALRERIHSTRYLSDADLWQIALHSSCNDATELLEYAYPNMTATELSTQVNEISLTCGEWESTFVKADGLDIHNTNLSSMGVDKIRVQRALVCTLNEKVQSQKWSVPINQILVYIALHAKDHVEERVGAILGGLVRTDERKLEDVRAELECEVGRITSLAHAISTISHAILQ